MSSGVFDVCRFFHGLFIPSTWVWCNMTVRSSPLTHSFFPSLAIPRDLWTSIAHLSLLWWKIISDWSRPLALLQWPVKYSSINHLWLLKEPDSWPPEIVGLHLRGDGGVWIKGGKGIRGSSLPYSETMLYFPGNTLSLTRSPGHDFLSAFYPFPLQKTTIKAERSDAGLKWKNGQAEWLENLSFERVKVWNVC